MRALVLGGLALLAGCGPISIDQAPVADIPGQCERQVYDDPKVKDILMKYSGSVTYARQHEDALKVAKEDATRRCLQRKGILPPGGGVERAAIRDEG